MFRILLGIFAMACIAATCKASFVVAGPRAEDFHAVHSLVTNCPCSSPELCLPLETAKTISAPHTQLYEAKKNKSEVFAFVGDCPSHEWMMFDWQKLTTIAVFGFNDYNLTCYAHAQGVKVVKLSNTEVEVLPNATARKEYIDGEIAEMLANSWDGLNLDFEKPVEIGSVEQEGYTLLAQEMAQAVHDALPGGQFSIDVAWSSYGIDGRNYDYGTVAMVADLLFIMAYDEMSQIWDEPCDARANSGLQLCKDGIASYTELGIPESKLVLGLPWYGYRYECIHFFPENNTCEIEKEPFRGCNCSDAVGRQFPYDYIVNIIEADNVTVLWDDETSTPFYNYYDLSFSKKPLQMRYDTPESLQIKVDYAMSLGLAGAGMWNANHIDYSDTPEAELQRQQMWGVMP